jgi:replication factor C subunit 1
MVRRVTTAPSKNTSYVVLGRDAGPKKLETIKAHDLNTLTEDQFLELIRQRPAGEEDAKFLEQKKKEEAKVIAVAKTMGLSKDAECVLSLVPASVNPH